MFNTHTHMHRCILLEYYIELNDIYEHNVYATMCIEWVCESLLECVVFVGASIEMLTGLS